MADVLVTATVGVLIIAVGHLPSVERAISVAPTVTIGLLAALGGVLGASWASHLHRSSAGISQRSSDGQNRPTYR